MIAKTSATFQRPWLTSFARHSPRGRHYSIAKLKWGSERRTRLPCDAVPRSSGGICARTPAAGASACPSREPPSSPGCASHARPAQQFEETLSGEGRVKNMETASRFSKWRIMNPTTSSLSSHAQYTQIWPMHSFTTQGNRLQNVSMLGLRHGQGCRRLLQSFDNKCCSLRTNKSRLVC